MKKIVILFVRSIHPLSSTASSQPIKLCNKLLFLIIPMIKILAKLRYMIVGFIFINVGSLNQIVKAPKKITKSAVISDILDIVRKIT